MCQALIRGPASSNDFIVTSENAMNELLTQAKGAASNEPYQLSYDSKVGKEIKEGNVNEISLPARIALGSIPLPMGLHMAEWPPPRFAEPKGPLLTPSLIF